MKECTDCKWEEDGFCDIRLKYVDEDTDICNSWEDKDDDRG